MIKTAWMMAAYKDCLHGKEKSLNTQMFSTDYLCNIAELTRLVNARKYRPTTSICFIVLYPKPREVFAADFRDRVIHHYVIMRLNPLFEKVFSPRTFNCRIGKGHLYGVQMLKDDMLCCSKGHTRDCYVTRSDIKGFFMSIRKSVVARIVDDFIVQHYDGRDKEDVRWLCKILIAHRPELDCRRQSSVEKWDRLEHGKSLFAVGEDRGLAIGNLFVQIFANFLLNDLDHLFDRYGVVYHGRYVDDFYTVTESKEQILSLMPTIRHHLEKLGLSLHPKKFYMQHYSKGISFTGYVVKPNRVYACNRLVGRFLMAVHSLANMESVTIAALEANVQRVNSYLGLLRHANSYAIRARGLNMIPHEMFEYLYIKGHYECVRIKQRCTTRSKYCEQTKLSRRKARMPTTLLELPSCEIAGIAHRSRMAR